MADHFAIGQRVLVQNKPFLRGFENIVETFVVIDAEGNTMWLARRSGQIALEYDEKVGWRHLHGRMLVSVRHDPDAPRCLQLTREEQSHVADALTARRREWAGSAHAHVLGRVLDYLCMPRT